MDFKQFTVDALRTESVPAVANTNPVVFTALQSAVLDLVDCFDLIKKNVFYGKPIDTDKFFARLTLAENTIATLRDQCRDDKAFINTGSDQAIDTREFHGILGIITEAGELLELVKLSKENIDPLTIADELGDLMWYTAILANKVGLDIEDQILEGVIAKLRKRFPDKFDAALATVRNKEAELAETAAVTGIADVVSGSESGSAALDTPAPAPKKVNKGGRPRKKPVAKKAAE